MSALWKLRPTNASDIVILSFTTYPTISSKYVNSVWNFKSNNDINIKNLLQTLKFELILRSVFFFGNSLKSVDTIFSYFAYNQTDKQTNQRPWKHSNLISIGGGN